MGEKFRDGIKAFLNTSLKLFAFSQGNKVLTEKRKAMKETYKD